MVHVRGNMTLCVILRIAAAAGRRVECQSRCGLRACRARYRGINTDRSQVTQFRRFEADTGSSEVQVAQLSARVVQLTTHLQVPPHAC